MSNAQHLTPDEVSERYRGEISPGHTPELASDADWPILRQGWESPALRSG
jgi:hypothetical protein